MVRVDRFRVRFHMGAPVVLSGHPLHFDGLLAALLDPTLDPVASRYVDPGLPLAREGNPSCYFYRASAWEIPAGEVCLDGLVRTTSWLEWAAEWVSGRPVEVGRGRYRQFREQFEVIAAPEVVFYAEGDVDRVAAVLDRAWRGGYLALGPMRRMGYGVVIGVEVEVTADDFSVVGPDGWVARHVPAAFAPPGAKGLRGLVPCRPPYWYLPRSVECLCPSPARWLPHLRPAQVAAPAGGQGQ